MLKASGAQNKQTVLVVFYVYEKSLRGDFQEPMAYVFATPNNSSADVTYQPPMVSLVSPSICQFQ